MAAPAGLTSAMVWLSLWVSTPMTWSTLSASMGRCLLRGVAVSVPALARETAWQDCDGSRRTADRLLIRPTSQGARPAPAPRQTVQCQGSPSGRQLRWESCRGTSADPDSDPSRPPWQSHSCVERSPRPAASTLVGAENVVCRVDLRLRNRGWRPATIASHGDETPLPDLLPAPRLARAAGPRADVQERRDPRTPT